MYKKLTFDLEKQKMIRYIKKFLNNLKLNARFNLFIVALLILVFSSLGFYLYRSQKQEIFKKANNQLTVMLEDLVDIFEVQTGLKRQSIDNSITFARQLIIEKGGIQNPDNAFIPIKVYPTNKDKAVSIRVKTWMLDGKILQRDRSFVEFMAENGVETASFLQKTKYGYVRISTNVPSAKDSTPALGTILDNSSPIIRKIEQGKEFQGRVSIQGHWYLAAFQPIVLDGEIVGAISVAVRQMDYEIIKSIFYDKKYFESGYPYVVSGEGFSLVNPDPTIEGSDLRGTSFLRNLRNSKNNNEEKFRYKWPENEYGQWKWTYLKYYEPLDIYIATSVFEYELYSGLTKIRNGILFGSIIAIILFYIGISLIIRPITSSIQRLVSIISAMSKGKSVKKIHYHRRDEIGDIIDSLNRLIQGLNETAKFSNEIEKGNFSYEFTPLSDEDVLGNSLLDMRSSLKKAKEEEEKRRIEDDKRKWTNEGLAKFSDILHRNSEDIKELSDVVTSNLVKYLKANQAGMFVINEEEKENIYFELMSAFAYNRKKHIDKIIQLGEGLVGTCAIEKETIYMTNIPEEYIEIESGLGMAPPRCILIVPLKFNEKILGIIEIASFKILEKHEINFTEKLAENIASTVSTAKINARTSRLLEESRQQAEEMSAQEEEMRQNLEELQATQEESARRQAEMSGVVNALNTSFLVAEIDMDGKVLQMNNSFLNILHLKSEVQAKGKFQANLLRLNSKQRKEYLDFWKNIQAGEPQEKIQHLKIEDEEYWLSETYTPIFDNNGNPYKVLNIAIDITESKKQEIEIQQLLKDSRKKQKKLAKQEKLNSFNLERLEKTQLESARKEAEISAVLKSIDHTVLRGEYQTDGTIIAVNENYLEKMGVDLNDMAGKNVRSFIPEDEKQEFDKIWEQVINGKPFEGVVKRQTTKGKDVWLLISYTPVVDNHDKIYKVLLLASDITKQKLSESRMREQAKKLLEKNKRFRETAKKLQALEKQHEKIIAEKQGIMKALDKTNFMLCYDFYGIVTHSTAFALKKLNKSKQEVIGKPFYEVLGTKKLHKSDKHWQDLKAGNQINEIRFVKENKQVFCLKQTHSPAFLPDGTLNKVYLVSHDITRYTIKADEYMKNKLFYDIPRKSDNTSGV